MAMDDAPKEETTIWGALNEWGESLPDWQRFVVSHAVRYGELTDEKVREANQLFLRHSTLDLGTEELPDIPKSVTGRDISTESKPLIFKGVNSLRNVNAIPEKSLLTFGEGLTVVYGHNGSGKSGFARIMSTACFSRSNPEILSNVYEKDASAGGASAKFVVNHGQAKDEIIDYSVGSESTALQRISVFDSSVAHIHLAEENTLGFQPAGFDVFDEVARVIGLVGGDLDIAIASRTRPNPFEKLFVEPGPLAQAVEQLGADTEMEGLRVSCPPITDPRYLQYSTIMGRYGRWHGNDIPMRMC